MPLSITKEQYILTNKEGFKQRFRLKATAMHMKDEWERKMGGEWFIIYDPKGVYKE